MKKVWKQYRLVISLVIGIAAGITLGLTLGEKAKALSPLGDLFLNLMFCIVVPLVFVSIASAVGNMVNMKRLGRILGYTVLVFVVTGLIAGILILAVVNIFPPAQGTNIPMESAELAESSSFGQLLVDAVSVGDFSELLSSTCWRSLCSACCSAFACPAAAAKKALWASCWPT